MARDAEELYGDDIDKDTFEQILEMDEEDDDEQEFSKGIVYGFFDQAENTFVDMGNALEDKNLEKLSGLGHFLKGSSATLGLTKVKNTCEMIQHLGQGMDATGSREQPKDDCLKQISECLIRLRADYSAAEIRLRSYYQD